MNSIHLIGRLTHDLSVKTSKNGNLFISFLLAVNRNKSCETTADFVPCTAFGKTAEIMSAFLKKGALVALEGSLQTEKAQDAEGRSVYKATVFVNRFEFCESKKKAADPLDEFGDYDGPSDMDVPF